MSIYGHDVFYIPRKLNNYDSVYGADDSSSYEVAYPIVMYIESVDGFTGDQEFLSKFGVEVRNQVTFSVATRTFNEEVSEYTTQIRPNEGDIIWFPLNQRAFVIRFVDKYQMFYQLGKLYTWKMTCEVFEYSGELLNTGIPEIDALQKQNSQNILDWTINNELNQEIKTEENDYIILENSAIGNITADDSDEIQAESDQFVDFSSIDPFSEGKI